MVLTEQQANDIYDVLVKHVGAWTGGRENFVWVMTEEGATEYRFQGVLGLGGKFYPEPNRWRVDAYPEDVQRSPEIAEQIQVTNAALDGLRAHHVALVAAQAELEKPR